MPPSYVRIERQDKVALLIMDNPATLNAMDEDLGPQLVAALQDLALDESCRALVLTGAGGVFSAGGNVVKAYRHQVDNPGARSSEVFQAYTKLVTRVVVGLTSMPQPVVAAVMGAASGAGLAWMLASDLVVAAHDARILPGFLAIGLTPAAGINQGLARLLGRQRVSAMLMLNQPLSPQEALRQGLVNRVVAPEQVLPAALELAAALARQPRQALAASKNLLRQSGRPGLYAMLENERRAVMSAADEPDFAKRAKAFLERS